jgi:hypothetical protein
MEKAKVRSVMPNATERIMSAIVSKVRQEIWEMSIEKSIKYLTHNNYPLKEAIRLAFMVKWNRKNNKRLLTLPLFIHTIHYVKYNEGAMVDVHKVKYVSTNKITQKQFENIEKNKEEGNIQITTDELLETKRLLKIGRSKLSYCLDNIYNYRKNEIIEIDTEQIL